MLGTLLLLACPADVYAPSIPGGGTGSIQFQLDGFTCASFPTSQITFSADGVSLGTESMAPGSFSSVFQLGSGIHTVGARTASGTLKLWPYTNESIPSGKTVTRILTC